MTATFVIVLFAVLSLAAFVLAAVRYFINASADSGLLPIDMESMATLIDDDQTQYLRHALTPKQFRRYEREQSLVIAEYVRRISHNSRLVIDRISRIPVTDIPTLSQRTEMLDVAMQTRTLCVSVLLRLYLNAYIPWCKSPLKQVASIHNSASRFIPKMFESIDSLT